MTDLVERFYAALERDPRRFRVPRTQDLPGDMLTDERLEPPWVAWRPVPGRVSEATWKQWCDDRGLRLPASFRDWFLARHTLQVDCGFLRLACSPSNRPFADLEELLEWDIPQIRAKQLFPIGDEGVRDFGPLCLDLRARTAEPPVVYWDSSDESIGPPIFSSFPKLLELASFAMENDLQLWDDDGLLSEFLALDRDGAGGPGRPYWSREAEA